MELFQREHEKAIRCIVYTFLALIVTLPLTCGYIMSGGIVEEWIARVQSLSYNLTGELFPAAAVNSNLWLLLPAVVYRASGSIVSAYLLYMIPVQLGAVLTARLMFGALLEDEAGDAAFFGTLLYVTCPYRIYVCYDRADLSQALAWTLLPLLVWATVKLLRGEHVFKGKHVFKETQERYAFVTALLCLGGIGYADCVFFVIVAGILLAVSIIFRKRSILPVLAGGSALFAPGLLRLVKYLFTERYADWGIPVESIMSRGYAIGEFFRFYVYREGHPGMGLGLFCAVLAIFGCGLVHNEFHMRKQDIFFGGCALVMALMSLSRFPWEFVQRLGTWALKAVSLLGSPAIFWGFACACLCVPGARAVGRLSGNKSKAAALGAPLFILLVCVALCVYQCNTLTYNRYPLNFK